MDDDETREAAARDKAFSQAHDALAKATTDFVKSCIAKAPDGDRRQGLAFARDLSVRLFQDIEDRIDQPPWVWAGIVE
jgi:hypothetical protein